MSRLRLVTPAYDATIIPPRQARLEISSVARKRTRARQPTGDCGQALSLEDFIDPLRPVVAHAARKTLYFPNLDDKDTKPL